jgi:hypothetical protein
MKIPPRIQHAINNGMPAVDLVRLTAEYCAKIVDTQETHWDALAGEIQIETVAAIQLAFALNTPPDAQDSPESTNTGTDVQCHTCNDTGTVWHRSGFGTIPCVDCQSTDHDGLTALARLLARETDRADRNYAAWAALHRQSVDSDAPESH